MTDDEFNQYLSGRYKEMLDFYDKRAKQNKKWYCYCSVYIISMAGLLAPIMTIDLGGWRYSVAFASASIAIASGLLAFFKFQENWLRYRSRWDCLKREPHLHKAKIGPYKDSAETNKLFVERVEGIFAKEGAEWLSKHLYEDEVKKDKPTSSKVIERRY
jgi:hypothetical protein